MVSYDDLRIANSKLIELEYTKQINKKLYKLLSNDSIIIKSYKEDNNNIKQAITKYKHQRTIAFSVTACAIIGLIISFIK